MDSERSCGADSNASTRSRRSSFALERASFDANRSSLEAFGARNASSSSVASLELAQVPHLPVSLQRVPYEPSVLLSRAVLHFSEAAACLRGFSIRSIQWQCVWVCLRCDGEEMAMAPAASPIGRAGTS